MVSEITNVTISDCLDPSADICTLKRKSAPKINIQFTYKPGTYLTSFYRGGRLADHPLSQV